MRLQTKDCTWKIFFEKIRLLCLSFSLQKSLSDMKKETYSKWRVNIIKMVACLVIEASYGQNLYKLNTMKQAEKKEWAGRKVWFYKNVHEVIAGKWHAICSCFWREHFWCVALFLPRLAIGLAYGSLFRGN